MHGPGGLEILGRSSVRRVGRGKAKSFGRNSMAADIRTARSLRKPAADDCHQHFWSGNPGGAAAPRNIPCRLIAGDLPKSLIRIAEDRT